MLKTKWYDHGDPSIVKKIYRFTLMMDRNDSIDVTFKVRTDWKESSTPDLNTTVTTSGSGTHYLDTEMVRKKIDTIITCHSYQIEMRTEKADEPWGIHQILVEWRPAGRTAIT